MVGTCQSIFDVALAYAKVREQFGVPIGSFQAIKHKFSDMYVALERARATAYYAVLTAKGFFPESWLTGFGSASSPLGYHPDRSLVPGVEIASGSLGHGLPIGVGLAHGLLARGWPGLGDAAPRVYVLVGDAELDEGSNSEAIVYAGAVGLPNLTVVAVDNQSSSYGWGPGGIEAHFAVSGWSAVRVSGRDHEALASAFRVTAAGAGSAGPQLVVATVEGEE
jgi:transketolase